MKRKFVLVFSFVLFLFQGLLAQNNIKYQALFVYNFTRYIEWPNNSSSEFVIGVVGKSNIYDELQSVTQGKVVGSQSIKIKKVQNVNEMGYCNILFISNDVSSQVSQLAAQIKDNNTLIITERAGLINKGAGINFIINDGKQKFEINKMSLEKRGLKVNKQLVDMAVSND
jgi:hypothetical protein